jgi:hypothetical protein
MPIKPSPTSIKGRFVSTLKTFPRVRIERSKPVDPGAPVNEPFHPIAFHADERTLKRIDSVRLKMAERVPETIGKKFLSSVLPSGSWIGKRCFILGGGPSLIGFDFERLRGEKIIAVNRAFESAMFADIMFSLDNRFYRWIQRDEIPGIRAKFAAFPGLRVWLDLVNYRYGSDIFCVRGIGREGLSRSHEKGLYHSNNSGYCALQLAITLGASPIYLLGFDCKFENGKSHYHSGYPVRSLSGSTIRFKDGFERLSSLMKKSQIRVINLNPASALRCFEFSTIDQVFENEPHNLKPEFPND